MKTFLLLILRHHLQCIRARSGRRLHARLVSAHQMGLSQRDEHDRRDRQALGRLLVRRFRHLVRLHARLVRSHCQLSRRCQIVTLRQAREQHGH